MRGENPDERRVPFPAAGIFIVIGVEADDARSPHLRRLACELSEKFHQFLAVLELLTLRLLQELGDAYLVGLVLFSAIAASRDTRESMPETW